MIATLLCTALVALPVDAAWQPDTWRAELALASESARLGAPELAARVLSLRGLDPAVYLRHRLGLPEVGRELSGLGPAAAPLCAELLVATLDSYPWASPHRYPPGAEVQRLRTLERRALELGLVAALGHSGHPLALPVLLDVAADPRWSASTRGAAAAAAGEAASAGRFAAVPPLSALAAAASAPVEVHRGALLGLGKAGWTDPDGSLAVLRPALAAHRGAALYRPTLAALSIVGGRWAAASLPGERDRIRAEVAGLLAAELGRPEALAVEQTLLEALAVVAHPAAREIIEAVRARPGLDGSTRDLATRALTRLDDAITRRR
jgi:hypothetical protein